MQRLALVILAACSGSSPDAPKPTPKPPAPSHPPAVIRAGHSAAIEIVAVTDDGRIAASQDAMGGTRLWPALDGSSEPMVVHMPAGRELAVGRDDDGFVLATLDAAGAIELVRLAATGAVRSRVQIGGDAVTEDIAMTPAGLLALRADQTLVLFAFTGAERSHLVPPQGERIASVLARNGHAIALLKGGTTVHARVIELGGGATVAWGRQSAALTLATKRVVLAPGGTRIAAASDKGNVTIIELATGATTTVCKGAEVEQTDGELDGVTFVNQFRANNTAAIGFSDDKTVTCFVGGRIETWTIDGAKSALSRLGHPASTPEMVAIANGLAVTAERDSLALEAGATTQYLGYGLANPNMVRAGPTGITLGHGKQPLIIDHTLHARRRFDLPVDANDLDDVLPLDDTHVLVSRSDTSAEAIVHHVKLLDLASHKSQALEYAALSYELRFEPSTHLLGLADKAGSWLVPLEPRTMHFDKGFQLATTARDVYLTDPALAGGLAAIAVRAENNRTFVDEIAMPDLVSGSHVVPRHSYEVFGEPVAVDRAGRVYVADGDTISAYTSGEHDKATRVLRFTQLGRAVVRPSPDATQLLVLGDNRIRMLDLQANQRWMIPASTAIDIGWVDGEPFARFAAGLAKLDVATGTLLERACGWSFGLSPEPFDVVGDSQSVCDAS